MYVVYVIVINYKTRRIRMRLLHVYASALNYPKCSIGNGWNYYNDEIYYHQV